MPVTLLYVGNVAFALMSLQNLNIPMYNTLKRMTPVIVLATKVSLAGHPHSAASEARTVMHRVPLKHAGATEARCLPPFDGCSSRKLLK